MTDEVRDAAIALTQLVDDIAGTVSLIAEDVPVEFILVTVDPVSGATTTFGSIAAGPLMNDIRTVLEAL